MGQQFTRVLNEVREPCSAPASSAPRTRFVDVRGSLDAMRLIKDEHEIEADAPRRRRFPRRAPARDGRHAAGLHEYQIEAELLHEFLRNGAQAVAYSSIVAAGPNACVLHYR